MLQKLKHKSAGEIVFRGQTLIRKKLEKRFFNAQRVNALIAKVPKVQSVEDFFTAKRRGQAFFLPDRSQSREIFLNELPEAVEHTINRANRFLAGQFDMLGAQFTFSDRIPWHVNPVTGKPYERAFYQDITIFKDDGVSDIKHVWEINRHQFFIEVAKAYFITKDEKYAERVIQWFNDWVQENPYKIGVNWTSALEAAVRAYSWLWSLLFLSDSSALTPNVLNRFLQQFYLHGKYINENLSFYFSPYNHLIGEVSALFMIGYLFPELPEAKSWARKSWKLLENEINKQFHQDGITVEQATFYHHFTLGFYLMPVVLRQQYKDTVSQQLLQRLKAIFEFNLHFTKPDGTFPWVGDIDNARSIYFRQPEQWDFRNILAIGAQLFQWPELKFVAHKNWEEVLWLFGAGGWQKYKQLPLREPEKKRAVFLKSGYAVARSHWNANAHFCWIDFGKIADGLFGDATFSAAHGQADILHFEITANGKNFIVDSGFHNYRGNFLWHRHFRLTRAHNSIEIDGQSQAVHGKKMMLWAHVPEPQLKTIIDRPELFYIRATHNGFKSLNGSPQHIRNFFFVNDRFWIIWDEILGERKHQVDAYLHFNHQTKITIEKKCLRAQLEDQNLIVASFGDLKKVEIKEGGKNPDEGWISPLYRHPVAAPQVRFSAKKTLPANHCLVIVPAAHLTDGQWTAKQTFALASEHNEIKVYFNPMDNFPVDQFFFFSTYHPQQGILFGKRQGKYVILWMKKDDNAKWKSTQEEIFEG